jgi:hypothetical protein
VNTVKLAIALLITCAPAWVWLEGIVPRARPARRALLCGYSLLLGMVGTTVILRLLSVLNIPYSLSSVGIASGLLLIAGVFFSRRQSTTECRREPTSVTSDSSSIARALLALLLVLIAFRLISLGLEAGMRPVFSWDAKQHWTKQAKVFFDLRSTVPYVSLEQWLVTTESLVYTSMHPDYTVATPLLQAWTATALGEWQDNLVSLPWLLTYIALGMIFYAQARIAGLSTVTAVAGTYMVMSLPYLNIHVALAGYADLLLAVCFLAAIAAFANWCASRCLGQLILALLSAGACLLIKNEGFYWFLSLLPGFALALLGMKRSLLLFGLGLAVLILSLWWLPQAQNLVVAGHSLHDIALQYRPQGWQPIFLSFLVHDNWHFLAYLFLAAVLLLPAVRQSRHTLVPTAAILIASLGLYLALYLLTRYSYGAVNYTSLNRVALQLMPAVGFFCLLVYGALLREQARDKTVTGQSVQS